MRILTVVFLAMPMLCAVAGQKYEADWASLDKRPTPEWWREAKFGIFVHWGVYSVPAFAPTGEANVDMCYSEHYQHRLLQKVPAFLEFNRKYNANRPYRDYAAEFKAEHFDAKKWADLFRRAGAKYAVLTSKHHDGFALWPSKASPDWNSAAVGPKRDICREFIDAMHDGGLHAGFYYSLLEYGNPRWEQAQTLDAFVRDVNMVQLKELADDYGADIIWPDGEWFNTYRELRSEEFLAWLFNESKVKDRVVVNDRWGRDLDRKTSSRGRHGGHFTTEYGFETGEISDGEKGKASSVHPWEECRGFGRSFGYNRFEGAEDYLSAAECIELLVRVVSGGGNLLLNIGPDRYGLVPPIMEERLLQIGAWLKVNGEAIYGTTAGRKTGGAKPADGVYCTKKGGVLYAIQIGWRNEPFRVKGVKGVKSVRMLGSDCAIAWRHEGGELVIVPPRFTPAEIPCEWAWTYRIEQK
jgi:alpha-L-fucosidase